MVKKSSLNLKLPLCSENASSDPVQRQMSTFLKDSMKKKKNFGIKIILDVLRLLGKFAEAQKDLATACKIDFDEAADEWLKEVS